MKFRVGRVFVIMVTWVLVWLEQLSLGWVLDQRYVFGTTRLELKRYLLEPGLLLPSYLICYWVCVRGVMAVL
ncbi:MAG: hypothetical protein AAGJ83_08140, partial [Planctomycetota bacterium]